MNKVFDNINVYSPIRVDNGRVIVSYDFEDLGDGNGTWCEVYFTHPVRRYPSLDKIKKAIIADINAETDNKIISGFVWNGKKVWLSEENQRNFSEAQRIAMMTNSASLPITFKLGENENGDAVYHTFTSLDELTQFCLAAVSYIQLCLTEGWLKKDNIDWSIYKNIVEPVSE